MRFSASIFFREAVSPGPLSGTPLRLFRIFRKFAAIFVNECSSAVSLTPVDKREEFYHLSCWLTIDLLVNFLNYFMFVLLINLHHTMEYSCAISLFFSSPHQVMKIWNDITVTIYRHYNDSQIMYLCLLKSEESNRNKCLLCYHIYLTINCNIVLFFI